MVTHSYKNNDDNVIENHVNKYLLNRARLKNKNNIYKC